MVAIATDGLTKVFDDGVVAVDNLSIEARSGEFLVLLGPTGSGKSTVLRIIAGLERPTRGHVRIDGAIVDRLPARDRRLAMVFQDYGLYPHLTVAQNIGFPLRTGVASSSEISSRVAEAARHLGVTELLYRFPAQLSGGQRQRVATARAIVRRPRGFLLDEPLSNLDSGLRAELRAEVAALARRLGVTTIYVTHDQAEAMTMADRVAVLRRGVLQQIGPPAQVYADPASLFVAAFMGTPRTTLLQGMVSAVEGRALVDLGSQVLEFGAGDPRLDELAVHHNERVTVALRADAVRPVPDGTAPTAGASLLRGRVRLVENLGHEVLVHVDVGGVPTSVAQSHLEHPDTGRQLAGMLAEEPPMGRPLRNTLSRIIPCQRTAPRATARTEYGFYPVFDPESSDGQSPTGDVIARVPAPASVRAGEPLTLAVDLDQVLLFDRAGGRIRLP